MNTKIRLKINLLVCNISLRNTQIKTTILSIFQMMKKEEGDALENENKWNFGIITFFVEYHKIWF